ncbi:chitin deacetylase 1 [Colletotrichum paranaense]|uniref:Chitin deacetylase 1 n=1 Tax=Colletotrichum paranaense TaxID=1914294 RepID=A0ABQ9SBM0_9PEZI|nr:chitin deacetylase 1 [Colletotrichum paranaense]KAK1531785.1 chitin deacetylase 1 [Colletotrichum paranaense]
MVHVEESLQIPRDFEGFGEEGFDPKWPDGARIAVSFVLNYEEGGERSTLDGDPFSEPYLWEKGASGGCKEGARYLNAEQDFEYGSRSASWRLIRLFKEFGWSFTTYAVAHALKRNPTFAKALVRDGHEIACHGLRWLDIWNYSLEEDKEYIKQNILMLKEVSGEMPVGAYFGRGTPNTPSLFPEVWKSLGGEFLWSSECYNDDVPYWLDLPWEKELPEEKREGMLLIPYNYDCNDGKFHMSPGFGSSVAETYEQYLKNTFDCLYREGGKLMNIPLHTRIIGKPGRSEALRKFMNPNNQLRSGGIGKFEEDPTTQQTLALKDGHDVRNSELGITAPGHARGCSCEPPEEGQDCMYEMQKSYTRALEERVAFLENKLAQVPTPEATTTPRETASNYSVPSGRDKNALSDVVAHVSLGNFEAPAYVGPSSGLSLALNLGEMVQATVWNKMLPDIQDGTTGNQANCINPSPRCITVEDLLAHSVKEPPSDEQGSQMLKAYTSQLHSKYPFLEPEELWKLHSERMTLAAKPTQTLTRIERFGIFKFVISRVSLGRPLSIADNQIDVELPNTIINGSPSASVLVGNDITLALVLFKLRRIESKIHHSVYHYGHSFIAVQTVFVAGVTLVYGIWTQGNALWSVAVSNDIRACSLVLFVMSERAPWVRKYRDAFEVLVNAAMEKLQDNEAGLAEMASAQMRAGKAPGAADSRGVQNPDLSGNETTTRPIDSTYNQFLMSEDGGIALGEFEGAWPMVAELANWIDQDTEGASPVWMPNFELLQSLSGTWNE